VSKTFTVSVASLLSILTTSLPNGVVAVAYSATLAGSGGTPPYTWSLASGQLHTGLSLSASGVTAGLPTAAGSYSFTIQVNDSGGQTASRSYSASIASPLGITTTSLSNGMVNVAYSDPLSASGGTLPYTWSLSAGSLPAGVTLSSSGTISGTATIPGSYSFTIQVSDSGGQNAPQAFGVTIYADTSLDQYGGVTQQPCPNGPTGDWYTQQIGKRWVLCDPLGNAFILRAVSEVGQTDSHTDATYVPSSEAATVTAKYPSGTDVFSNASFARLQTWGFNASGYGTYHNATVSTITPIKMPFVDGLSQANNPWMGCEASAQCKNIWNLLWPPLHAYDSDTSHNDPDVYEPTYPSYLATAYASDSNIKNWSASPYAVGFYNGDSDYCSFCSAGNDFPNSVYWPHAIWMTLGSAPHVWLNRRGSNALYTSSTNNTKAQLASYLQTEYETISALNTAWNTGGYYTTFGSSGTQVSGGACATGTGGSGPYTCSPNTNIDPFSLEILVGGTPVCADDGFGNLDAPGGATAGCGTVTYSTGAISVSYTVATGTAITLNYWYNGYGVGTGLLDEWCNQSVHAWVGDIQCLNNGFAGNGTCNPGSVTTAAYQTDLNNFLQQYATEFFSLLHTAYVNSLPSGHTHKLWFGMDVIGQVPGRAPARCPVLAAAGVVNDVVMLSTDTSTAQLNFITSCVGNKPFIIWENVSANCDSDWYGYCSTETNAGNVANQNVRAVQFNTDITDLWNYQSSAGNYQWVGFDWWAFLSFNFWEHQNFGLVSWRDNAYDGHEDVSGSVSCSAPISSYTCGGEQHNYGNFLGPATLTNNWADTQLLLLK